MGAFEDFVDVLKRTQTMQGLLKSLEEEPAKLLSSICREYEKTNKAVPDHHLHLSGYFSEVMLRALLSANLVTKEPEDRFSLYGYKPTEAGLNYYKGMVAEKRI
jgi:hypothetical protein